ncbi:hypothetical protein MTO96_044313 [Rhipicephalus appendiculatus]
MIDAQLKEKVSASLKNCTVSGAEEAAVALAVTKGNRSGQSLVIITDSQDACRGYTNGRLFFVVRLTSLNTAYATLDTPEKRAAFVVVPLGEEVQIRPLEELPTLVADRRPFYLAFSDPSTSPTHPGWPLRNLLALVVHRWGHSLTQCSVLCYRREARHGQVDSSHSLVLDVQLCASVTAKGNSAPMYVGWERNAAGQLGPRSVDLSASLDPARLMENALELNLQLMRWRLAPTLDLEAVASTNAPVAVHCTGLPGRGSRPKCDAAAEALRAVSPAVHARGENLRVPMAGHSVPAHAEEHVQADVRRLEALVAEHDAVFLLLDTREARWLPTVVAAAQRKVVINAALGFDTFLVMRHGVAPGEAGDDSEKLGCYFCNDVVGPADSTRDRTLDQQCTVTRPGVGAMAGALAAELLVGLLQSPPERTVPRVGQRRPPARTPSDRSRIRFEASLPGTLLDEYARRGWEFVLQVLNDAAYLERLTGLSRLHEETDLDQVWALSDSEDSAS